MNIQIINGPNLNLLGTREPHIYGSESLEDIKIWFEGEIDTTKHLVNWFQSNHEGELIDAIHAARERCSGIIINPGAFTHYAWAIHDALATFEGPVIELHISNPASREPWRHTSVVAPVSSGTVAGFGAQGYEIAINAIAGMVKNEKS